MGTVINFYVACILVRYKNFTSIKYFGYFCWRFLGQNDHTPTHSSLMMVVMQLCLHLYFVLFKCNRVTTRVSLISAVFLAIGLFFCQPSLSAVSLSSGMGIISGYTLGFLFGLKFDLEGVAVASLAGFLCLGLCLPFNIH